MVDGPPPSVGDQQIPERVDDALRVAGDHWVSRLMALHPERVGNALRVVGDHWVSRLTALHPLLGINGSSSMLMALCPLLGITGSHG